MKQMLGSLLGTCVSSLVVGLSLGACGDDGAVGDPSDGGSSFEGIRPA